MLDAKLAELPSSSASKGVVGSSAKRLGFRFISGSRCHCGDPLLSRPLVPPSCPGGSLLCT